MYKYKVTLIVFSSSHDTLDAVLEIIIAISSPVVVTLSHEAIDEFLTLGIIKHPSCREEAIFELLDSFLTTLEARQIILTQEHHFHNDDDLLSIFLKCREALPHEVSEFSELLGSVASEDLDQLSIKLERSRLKLHALTWSIRQQETKVNVEQMSFNVNHDILIMSILNLKNEA